MVINKQFWKNKKVLITGHTGFKGSWLSLWLQKLGSELVGFSKSIPTKPSLFELANVKEKMTTIFGDICDYNQIEKVFKEQKPEVVIHMAAQSLVRLSYNNPRETYSTNVIGTVNLLDAIRKTKGVRVVINVTSDKCYDIKSQKNSYNENDTMGGYDPYSNSKACSELVTSSFRKSFFNPDKYKEHGVALASTRSGNTLGGGDWATDRLIPDIMRGIFNKTVIKIRNPQAVRPWQHVLEPLGGYLLLAEHLWEDVKRFTGAWNFGPNNNDKPVSWILEKVISLWGSDLKWDIDNDDVLHEEDHLRLDCSKAKSQLGWTPKTNLEDALVWTIDWYKQYIQNQDMENFTKQQIKNFTSPE